MTQMSAGPPVIAPANTETESSLVAARREFAQIQSRLRDFGPTLREISALVEIEPSAAITHTHVFRQMLDGLVDLASTLERMKNLEARAQIYSDVAG
jgi:hypothetical protein